MKKIYTLGLILLFTSFVNAQNPVPNPGFETWSGSPSNPVGWNGNFGIVTPITQVPGNSGYAAQGSVINLSGTNYPPFFYTGTGGNGFPISQYFHSLQFYYKANLVSGDLFEAQAIIYDYSGSVLATGIYDISTSAASFTFFSLSIDSFAAGIPDHATIYFTISPATGNPDVHIGSYYVVDDVALSAAITSTKEIAQQKFSPDIFPTLFKDLINIRLNDANSKIDKVFLKNMLGQTVFSAEENSFTKNLSLQREGTLDTHDLIKGIYFLQLFRNGIMYTYRIVKGG